MKGGYSVGEEAKGSAEEFGCVGFIYEDQGWSVFVEGVVEEEMQAGEFGDARQ